MDDCLDACMERSDSTTLVMDCPQVMVSTTPFGQLWIRWTLMEPTPPIYSHSRGVLQTSRACLGRPPPMLAISRWLLLSVTKILLGPVTPSSPSCLFLQRIAKIISPSQRVFFHRESSSVTVPIVEPALPA